MSDGGTCTDVDGDGLVDIYWTGFENNGFQPDAIWLNQGDRAFKLIWKTEGPAQAGRGTMTCDFDNDGDMDIYVTNYYAQPNVLWINDGTGKFTDGAGEYGVRGGNGYSIGSAFGDIDNDGYIDLFAGNFARAGQPQSQFLRNLGPDKKFHFENKGTCGVNQQQSCSPALGDYDNDGDLDLFFAAISYGGVGQCVLYRNEGDWKFKDVTGEVGLGALTGTSQAAWGDFDNDGDLDLASGGRLWRNSGNKNKWLKVRPVGTADYNRSAGRGPDPYQAGGQDPHPAGGVLNRSGQPERLRAPLRAGCVRGGEGGNHCHLAERQGEERDRGSQQTGHGGDACPTNR